LHFTQSATATNECDRTGGGDSGEDLEESPGLVVEEKDPFDREKRAQEDSMRNGSCLESIGEVADVGTEKQPLEELDRRGRERKKMILTTPARTGRAPNTNATNASVITIGGLRGSSLKMWWISGSFPYLEISTVGTG
jgi:hypothetical protein